MSFKPLVSVIIPTFNRADKLNDAIESVKKQSYRNIQLIVVDDGSTDNTKELLKNIQGLEYFYQANAGQAAARNCGLKNAKGTIIASLDSDDIWYPEFLERCVEKLENNHHDFVFANWDQDSRDGLSWDFLRNDPFLKPYYKKIKNNWVDLNSLEVRELFIKACPSPSSSVVIRKSSIISGWNEKISIGDDWFMYLEIILNKKCSVAFTMEKLWRKRQDEINVYDGRKWSEVLEFLYIKDLKIKMEKFGPLMTEPEMQILEKRYMSSLVELSKHNLIREFNISQSLGLLGRSFAINVPYTLKTIPSVYMKGFERKVRALIDRFNKKNHLKK